MLMYPLLFILLHCAPFSNKIYILVKTGFLLIKTEIVKVNTLL